MLRYWPRALPPSTGVFHAAGLLLNVNAPGPREIGRVGKLLDGTSSAAPGTPGPRSSGPSSPSNRASHSPHRAALHRLSPPSRQVSSKGKVWKIVNAMSAHGTERQKSMSALMSAIGG